jgi:hypothetical protein
VAKPGMTIEEHREGGIRFLRLRHELMSLLCLYSERFRLAPCDRLKKALDIIDRFRGEMDGEAYREHYTSIGWEVEKLYYPSPEERKKVLGSGSQGKSCAPPAHPQERQQKGASK